jgi:hypothetical protein
LISVAGLLLLLLLLSKPPDRLSDSAVLSCSFVDDILLVVGQHGDLGLVAVSH